MKNTCQYIRWFEELGSTDVAIVGGKNASLGEMYSCLTPKGVRVPNGFATTAEAYRMVLEHAGAWDELRQLFASFDVNDVQALAECGVRARDIVYQARFPDEFSAEIVAAYQQLQAQYGDDMSVAVRSSATAEDLPTASFAGQHDTFLNIAGDDALIDACKHCFASIFTDRAIQYRINNGFDHFKVYLSACVMKMVRSDKSASGVMFSLDTESGNRDFVYITGAYGLGENVVQGAVDPDEFYVHKATFRNGFRNVLRRVLGQKQITMVYSQGDHGEATKNIATDEALRNQLCISDDDVITLADYAIKIEEHYSGGSNHDVPMDMEWARDGDDNELYIVQARPETVVSQRQQGMLQKYVLTEKSDILVSGRAVGTRIASGMVRVIDDVSQLSDFQDGEVLVSRITTPDWGPVMKRAAAIVTDRGGRTCHAAIVARELGIAAIVGTHNATQILKTGDTVTVSCSKGDTGNVYQGALAFEIEEIVLDEVPRTRTKLMLNLANPGSAFAASMVPNDGVGLARVEFIINEVIQAHPMALLHAEKITDSDVLRKLAALTRDYPGPEDFYISKLAEGVATIAAAFYPKPVIVRLSDFKSNEYASMLGGKYFEPDEENPMLGFRGASRYIHPDYAEAFAMECMAMKTARDTMGFDNIKLMIPFCRRVAEARRVIELMAENGLKRGDNGLEIYVMCEIPNNVLMIDEFSQYFDGFSIGSNDLTQLTLGVDRDSELVAADFDERDPGVMRILKMAIEGAKRNGKYVGICGQAPSDYPQMAEYLVGLGIDSLSLSPDSIIRIITVVDKFEKGLSTS